jgi:murein DD-endopeptidase MepM/ murein hydrolase activator NlpD
VLAVADARVVSIINDLPENAGANPQEGRRPTVETISGNTVILDLGNGAYALYGHLQPGSVLVHPGEAVHTGQVLAKLGNSGNSDAPHLHFQLMDAPSALGAEGLPYAIARFTMAGVASDPAVLDGKAAWKASGLLPCRCRRISRQQRGRQLSLNACYPFGRLSVRMVEIVHGLRHR